MTWHGWTNATPVAYLYNGIPVESLNHNISLAESLGIGEVMSHGSSTSLDCAAQIRRTGTVEDKHNKLNDEK